MDAQQADRLGEWLREQRQAAGLSKLQLAQRTGMSNTTISRIENGVFAAPSPDKLTRIAEALGLELADVFAMADYAVPSQMPTFKPYLRTRYPEMPPRAVKELERYFDSLAERYGIDPAGPAPGEDEAPAQKRQRR